jgi:hypothetical protein
MRPPIRNHKALYRALPGEIAVACLRFDFRASSRRPFAGRFRTGSLKRGQSIAVEKNKAIDAIDSVADIVPELAAANNENIHAMRESLTVRECSAILSSMRLSLQAHD